jgi:parallel beta-helix repeat protein
MVSIKKKLTSATVIILLFGLVIAGNCGNTVQAATQVSGIISQDATWTKANSPYDLAGNVLVGNGVTLAIDAGVTVNFGSYYIMVNGTLAAKGASGDPVIFSGGSITFTATSTAWNEQTASGCIIENAQISTAIECDNAVKLNHDTINTDLTLTSQSILSNSDVTGTIFGGTITGNTIAGGVSGEKVQNNRITGGVSGTLVSGNVINGWVTAEGNCTITSNTIIGGSGECGINVESQYIASGGFPTITDNVVKGCGIGINIDILIRDWFAANIPQVKNNFITQNGIGIQYTIGLQNHWIGDDGGTSIESNTISQNEVGVSIYGSMDHCQIVNNNIQDNNRYNFQLNETSSNVDVSNNWWGTTDTAVIDQKIWDYNDDFTLGKVNYTPFLTEANPNAMPGTEPPPTPLPSPSPSPTPTPLPTDTPAPTPQPSSQTVSFELDLWQVTTVALLCVVAVLLVVMMIFLRKRSPQSQSAISTNNPINSLFS